MTVFRCAATAMFLLASSAPSVFATPLVFTRSTAGVQLNTGFTLCADDTGNVANTTTTASCTSANGDAGALATFGRIGAAHSCAAKALARHEA